MKAITVILLIVMSLFIVDTAEARGKRTRSKPSIKRSYKKSRKVIKSNNFRDHWLRDIRRRCGTELEKRVDKRRLKLRRRLIGRR